MAAESPRVRLVVLYGGVSAEHDVSCMSAKDVLRAVDPERYDLVPIGINPDGQWTLSEATAKALSVGPEALPEALSTDGETVDPIPSVMPVKPDQPVVVFPLLHGPMGEDGTVQGLLELADVAYVGSGVLGSSVCMDKAMAKALAAAYGIPQPRYLAARADDADRGFRQRVADYLRFPVFVKPANMGSSIGVNKVSEPDDLEAAIAAALTYDEWVLVEEAVQGREIEVGVLGNAEPRASVPGEILPTHEFYDYDDKYVDGNVELRVPAELPPDVTARARSLALSAFKAFRCDGLARCDFFYEENGRGLLLNEVNTMPGFTPFSMYPMLWEATGVSYRELVDELVRLALERHASRQGHGRPPKTP
jgi:D-alanine-D-alanine ligase